MTTTGLVLTILGVLAAIAAVVWAHAQYRLGRRRVVRVNRLKTSLVRKSAGIADLEIRLRGWDAVVEDPYSVTITMQATKPNDVAVEAFGDRPLQLDYGVPVVSLIGIKGHPDADLMIDAWRMESTTWSTVDTWPTTLEIRPALLSVREPWSVTVLCEGNPDAKINSRLANVDFVTVVEARRRMKRFTWRAGAFSIGVGLAGSLLGA